MGWDTPVVRLPFILDFTCPVCGNPITRNRPTPVFLSDAKTNRRFVREFNLPYCLRCSLPYVNEMYFDRIWENTKIKPEVFEAGNDRNRNVSQMLSGSKNSKASKNIQSGPDKSNGEMYLGFPVEQDGYSDPYKPHNIVFNNEIRGYCPDCDRDLMRMNVGIPFDAKKKVVIYGQGCRTCDTLYVHQCLKTRMQKLLHNNRFASNFELLLDSPYDFQVVEEAKKIQLEEAIKRKQKIDSLQPLFEKHPSAHVILLVRDIATDAQREVVIVNNAVDKDVKNHVYHYSSSEGLEYLSAAFADERDKNGDINSESFSVDEIIFKKDDRGKEIINEWILDLFLYIRPDGGNRSSTLGYPYRKLVDMLVYCTKTDRYEIMKTTWDTRNDVYYTDMRHYWDFVYRYGKPEIELVFFDSKKNSYRRDWKDLNDESILMQFGYNAKEGGPDEDERRKILGDLIDLQILTQNEILRYLEFFINHHRHHYNAIAKWTDDREYIMDYEYDPYRFVMNR